jgi:glucose-6-phosphate isomerase
VVPDVWEVLDKIKDFTDRVRNGTWVSTYDMRFVV